MKKTLTRCILALGVLVLLSAGAAKADTLLSYTISGPGLSASFVIPTVNGSPDVASFIPFYDFTVTDVTGTANGSSVLAVSFFTGWLGLGGLLGDVSNNTNMDLYGPQLFSGPVWDPTLLTGKFALSSYSAYLYGWKPEYTLYVTPATVATPESSTLLLVAMGGLALVTLRLKRLV